MAKSISDIAALLQQQKAKLGVSSGSPVPNLSGGYDPAAPMRERGSGQTPSISPQPIALHRTDGRSPAPSSGKRPREDDSASSDSGSASDLLPDAAPPRKGSGHITTPNDPTYSSAASVPRGTTTYNRSGLPHDIKGCRKVDAFKKLNEIAEGTFGKVWRARDKETKCLYALKQVKMEKEKEGFPLTALREIHLLMSLEHDNIVDIKEVVVGSSVDSVFLVMEYVEHDMRFVMDGLKHRWTIPQFKCLMQQLLKAVCFMHQHWILHRDLKTSNLLYTNSGVLKVCDFGLARLVGDQNPSLTAGTCTLWYRSPEVLLDTREYASSSDVWAVGCIGAELILGSALLQGKNETDQLQLLFGCFGQPSAKMWAGYSQLPRVVKGAVFTGPSHSKFGAFFRTTEEAAGEGAKPFLPASGVAFLEGMLQLNPQNRASTNIAMSHAFFSERPLPQSVPLMPTFPATNEMPRKKMRAELQRKRDAANTAA